MEYIELLKSFGAKVGLADLEPTKDGIFSIEIDNMIVSFVRFPNRGSFSRGPMSANSRRKGASGSIGC